MLKTIERRGGRADLALHDPAVGLLDRAFPVAHLARALDQGVAPAAARGVLQQRADHVAGRLGIGRKPAVQQREALRRSLASGGVVRAAQPGDRRVRGGATAMRTAVGQHAVSRRRGVSRRVSRSAGSATAAGWAGRGGLQRSRRSCAWRSATRPFPLLPQALLEGHRRLERRGRAAPARSRRRCRGRRPAAAGACTVGIWRSAISLSRSMTARRLIRVPPPTL